jgi:dolichyl-phosphate-mannose--protein O-mannosyl transferase
MFVTGIGLGCSVSVKWVGLFNMLMIGIATVNKLWEILGDEKTSMVKQKKNHCTDTYIPKRDNMLFTC